MLPLHNKWGTMLEKLEKILSNQDWRARGRKPEEGLWSPDSQPWKDMLCRSCEKGQGIPFVYQFHFLFPDPGDLEVFYRSW